MAIRHEVDGYESGIVWRHWGDTTPEIVYVVSETVKVRGSENSLAIEVDQVTGSNWFVVTNMMTNQHGYNGPVMHDSEFISVGMIEEILAEYDHREHYFTWLPVEYGDNITEGWVILARNVVRDNGLRDHYELEPHHVSP